MRKRYMVIAAGVSLVVIGVGAGVASASIPDSGGVIHACYQNPPPAHGANLQVIDTGNGGSCSGGMAALTWNQTGPAGPAGATGPAGPQATAQDVTSQVTYNVGSGGTTPEYVTLDCPAGTLALNGGVQSEAPGPVDPGASLLQSGSAVEAFGQEMSGGLPRPVNSGASWRILVNVGGAEEVFQSGGTRQDLPAVVTFYVICE